MSATNTAGTQSPTTEKAENPIGAQGDSKPISDAAQRSEQSQTRGAGDIHSGDAGNKLGDVSRLFYCGCYALGMADSMYALL